MTQPFAIVVVENTGRRTCAVSGFPRLHADHTRLAVSHGVYERGARAPHRVNLPPHGRAYFYVGTSTAYEGGRHPETLRALRVALPLVTHHHTVVVDLAATRASGHPLPVGITELEPCPPPTDGRPTDLDRACTA